MNVGGWSPIILCPADSPSSLQLNLFRCRTPTNGDVGADFKANIGRCQTDIGPMFDRAHPQRQRDSFGMIRFV